MSLTIPLELRVSVDVGCYQHRVAIGLSSGEVLDEFDLSHHPEGFDDFFARIEHYQAQYGCPVAVAMEGFNGYARPPDQLIQARAYRLYTDRPVLGGDVLSHIVGCLPIESLT